MWCRVALFCGVCVLISACASDIPKSQAPALSDLTQWEKTDFKAAHRAFMQSCANGMAKKQPAKWSLSVPYAAFKSGMEDVCRQGKTMNASRITEVHDFFEQYFVPVPLPSVKEGFFTGYYIPELEGSLTRTARFRYPVYGVPKDFNTPYLIRETIDTNGLPQDTPVIAWVDDRIDLFFLHVQGSGRIRLPDGKIIQARFAAKNGQPYQSIGKYMIEQGYLARQEVSLFTIKSWLRAHPDQLNEVLWQNPSFIFFERATPDSVKGAESVPLTPYHSLAIDPAYHAYGTVMYIHTRVPDKKRGSVPFNQLIVAQDTGSAIKGAGRGDIYFGTGSNAEYLAGNMQAKGTVMILVPRSTYEAHATSH